MKINRIFVGLVIAAFIMGGLSSCKSDKDFITEKSFNFDDETFYNTESDMEMGLSACYAEMQYLMLGNMHANHSWMIQGMGLDTFTATNGNDQFGNWVLSPDNGYTRHWMDYLYRMANRCNTVIDMIDQRTNVVYSTDTKKNELRGEAIFLRGWAYRNLAGMFGNVVILDHRTTEAKYDYAPSTRQEVWEFVQKDFAWASENLPVTPRLTGCVTKAAADAELAEVDLALGKFQEAVDATTRVIDGTDGPYHIMTTRFGSRKDEKTDRYGNALNPYWDLFRGKWGRDLATGKTKAKATIDNPNSPDNAEAIWVCQYNYGTFEKGGGGDSWWRVHNNTVEANWTPNCLIGHQRVGTRKSDKGQFYFYGDDVACFPYGVTVGSSNSTVVPPVVLNAQSVGYDPKTGSFKVTGSKVLENKTYTVDGISIVYDAKTDAIRLYRQLANVPEDSLGSRVSYTGMTCIPVEYVCNSSTNLNGGLWDDPDDFRGSEAMMQKNFYVPGGSRWFDCKAAMYKRAAAAKGTEDEASYALAGSDTTAIFPRFWKFSDDCHPNMTNKEYDVDWYMIRVSEVYLLRAEAYLALGNKAMAANDINVVRTRANAKPCTADQVDIDYILDERARELLGEEHRYITLNRLSCNPNCGSYVTSKYPTQDATTSNTMYERVHKYGYGYENFPAANNPRTTYTDAYGKTRHYSAFHPWNYEYPIPTQVLQANSGYPYPQNPGY